MSHKGSRSRVSNHEAAREAWERTQELIEFIQDLVDLNSVIDAAKPKCVAIINRMRMSEPPRAITDAKAMNSPDPPKQNERADSTLASATFPTTMKPGEANDKQ